MRADDSAARRGPSSDIARRVERLAVAPVISTGTISPGRASPAKFTTLLWRVRPRSRLGSCARRALDEHLERAADEALRALARAALDDLDEALHALDLHLVRHEPSASSAASVPRRGEKMNVNAPS